MDDPGLFPIRSVLVHGHPYSVTRQPLKKAHGEFDNSTFTLRINSAYAYPVRVLVHEMTHAGLAESGLDELLDPKMVEAICCAMEQTFGPLLKEYING